MTDLIVNGWRIYLHPLFIEQYGKMIGEVRKARASHPEAYKSKRCAKLLAATNKMAFGDIPSDPAHPRFRLGDTLGSQYSHWFRGKYVAQYRLFFRFSEKQKIIVLVWVNDEDTKRAYGSNTDAYEIFKRMLKAKNPPDEWMELLTVAKAATDKIKQDELMIESFKKLKGTVDPTLDLDF